MPLRCYKFVLCFVFCVSIFYPAMAAADNYIVGPGDNLNISVYDHPDLTLKIRVSGDGNIRFPMIGEFLVGGKTPSEISGLIEKKLSDGYILNPQVSVALSEFQSRKATILGEVDEPGLYELVGSISLLELISKAGGLTPDAGRFVYITRNEPADDGTAKQKVIKADLSGLVEKGDISQNLLVKKGDSIFIPEAEKIYVTGEVKKPAAYRYDDDLTLIKVIANAGGLTDKAAPKSVRIIRDIDGKRVVIEDVAMDTKVMPNDVVVVPESFF